MAGLGTFYLTCECQKGVADKESDFNVKEHLKALHIRFLPDQTQEDNLSSREFIKKAEFVMYSEAFSLSATTTVKAITTTSCMGHGPIPM